MNTELKALIGSAFDVIGAVKDAVAKADFVTKILPDLYKVFVSDLPNVISNWSDLKKEIDALSGSDAEADLIAYICAEFAGIDSDEKAKNILNAVLKLLVDVAQDALLLEKAIKG